MASNQNADDYHAQACDRERDNGSERLARARDERVMRGIIAKLNTKEIAPTSANFENSEIAFLMRD